MLRHWLGDAARASAALEEIADGGFKFPRDRRYLAVATQAAELCALVGAREHAPKAYAAALPLANLNADMSFPGFSFGSVSRQLGMLATLMERYEDAERHFEDALAMNIRMGHRPATAKTEVEFAEMLLKRGQKGDAAKARELAAAALTGAEAMAMRPTVERATAVLRATHAAPPPAG